MLFFKNATYENMFYIQVYINIVQLDFIIFSRGGLTGNIGFSTVDSTQGFG